MNTQTIIVEGKNFSDEESFYVEIDRVLTKDLEWRTGHNLNAFNDLLRGGFGVHEYEEPIMLIWRNYTKSKEELSKERLVDGITFIETIIRIIQEHEHIELIIEL